MKRKIALLLAMLVVFSLLTACGGNGENPTAGTLSGSVQTAEGLALASWSMTASTWSSPNGATIHLSAIPAEHTEGQSAVFVVRLEGEDVANVLCRWENGVYTASAELNAKNGYCYYVIITEADGTSAEVGVNLPTDPYDEAFINMAQALESYCNLMPTEYSYADNKLTLTAGTAQVQPPRITNKGESITCAKAELVLTFNEEEFTRVPLALPQTRNTTGGYDIDLAGVVLDVPAMEDDQLLYLRLDVELSNGQLLSDEGAMWIYIDGGLQMTVG